MTLKSMSPYLTGRLYIFHLQTSLVNIFK